VVYHCAVPAAKSESRPDAGIVRVKATGINQDETRPQI
jgi:hypothetical protein